MADAGSQQLKTRALELLQGRKQLPIWAARKELLALLANNDSIVLAGETGSGKTTQAPQFALQHLRPRGLIACTQPRRVAAITVAQRVAAEQGCTVGGAVGYAVRFDRAAGVTTKLQYMTDGLLIREAMQDETLSRFSVVFVDEAHERSINTDILLGILKRAQRLRAAACATAVGKAHADANGTAAAGADATATNGSANNGANKAATCADDGAAITHSSVAGPLKLVVMSATLDQQAFVDFLGEGAVAAHIAARQYPIEVLYTAEPQDSYARAAINATLQVHLDEPDGAILVFLTGQEEIESVSATLTAAAAALTHPHGLQLQVVPMYAALPPAEQAAAFAPPAAGTRRVVLATNIAETSVTLPGVRFVIDTGLVKARAFHARRGIQSLQVVAISKAQAAQRAGRAGREAPGKCLRLYTEATYHSLVATAVPELLRSNLAGVVLQIKAAGVRDLAAFPLLDPPPPEALAQALRVLYALEAIDAGGTLTPKGQAMARLPLEPQAAAILLAAVPRGCMHEALAVVAMLGEERVFYTPASKEAEAKAQHKLFHSPLGDHIAMLTAFQRYTAVAQGKRGKWCRKHFLNGKALRVASDVYQQVQRHLQDAQKLLGDGSDAKFAHIRGDQAEKQADYTGLRQALTCGLLLNAAQRQPDGRYRVLATGETVQLHPSSVLLGSKPKCIVFEEVLLTTRVYANMLTVIDAVWLPQLVPRIFAHVFER